jgi:hypothetical protein
MPVHFEQLERENERLRADNARLRAALEEAHGLLDGYDGLPGLEEDARRVYGALLALRAALRPAEEGEG